METYSMASEYLVSAIPLDHTDAYEFRITVELRNTKDQLWAVVSRGVYCLSDDGVWDYEMQPSSRTEEWLARHRFPLHRALELAREVAPKMVVNGFTVQDILSGDPHVARAARVAQAANAVLSGESGDA